MYFIQIALQNPDAEHTKKVQPDPQFIFMRQAYDFFPLLFIEAQFPGLFIPGKIGQHHLVVPEGVKFHPQVWVIDP
jgi:hypothetical protein